MQAVHRCSIRLIIFILPDPSQLDLSISSSSTYTRPICPYIIMSDATDDKSVKKPDKETVRRVLRYLSENPLRNKRRIEEEIKEKEEEYGKKRQKLDREQLKTLSSKHEMEMRVLHEDLALSTMFEEGIKKYYGFSTTATIIMSGPKELDADELKAFKATRLGENYWYRDFGAQIYKKDWYSYSIHASTAEEMESIKRKVAPMGYHVSDSSCVLFVRGQAAAIHSFLARIEEDDIPGYLYFLADRNAGGKDFKTATIHFRDVNGASDAVKYFCSSDRPSDGITFNFHELSRSLVG